jgi:hypothetical protein
MFCSATTVGQGSDRSMRMGFIGTVTLHVSFHAPRLVTSTCTSATSHVQGQRVGMFVHDGAVCLEWVSKPARLPDVVGISSSRHAFHGQVFASHRGVQKVLIYIYTHAYVCIHFYIRSCKRTRAYQWQIKRNNAPRADVTIKCIHACTVHVRYYNICMFIWCISNKKSIADISSVKDISSVSGLTKDVNGLLKSLCFGAVSLARLRQRMWAPDIAGTTFGVIPRGATQYERISASASNKNPLASLGCRDSLWHFEVMSNTPWCAHT